MVFKENEYIQRSVFDKENRLLDREYRNYTYSNGNTNITKERFIYNDQQELVAKLILGSSNELESEERYFYSKGRMIRYTLDQDLSDTALNEEKRFDDAGKVVYHYSKALYEKTGSTRKYFYDARHLETKEEWYEGDHLVTTYQFKYR